MGDLLIAKPGILISRPDPYGARRLWIWLPPLLAVTVIAFESTNTFSAEHTSRWLRPFFEHLLGRLSAPAWDHLHHYLRKTGHFVGYGLVCFSFLWSWLTELAALPYSLMRWRLRSSFAAICSTVVVAGLDEWHQTFIPSRTGKVSDVLLDTSGGLVALVLIWLAVWHRSPAQDHR